MITECLKKTALGIYSGRNTVHAELADMLKRGGARLPLGFELCLCASAHELAAALDLEVFDALFLDIEPDDERAAQTVAEIQRCPRLPALVFVSAHEAYCRRLFRSGSAAFLTKPVREIELWEILNRITGTQDADPPAFTYRQKDRLCRVPVEDILFFESNVRKVRVVTSEEEAWFYRKLDQVEADLPGANFLRIHHSFLVNLDKIEGFTRSQVLLGGDYRLPISQRREEEARARMAAYYSEHEGHAVSS
ncbi:MAG: LytTR family DNA-binding domain-containing protein [Spirochaetaceae bacterium]|jgi:DNA-binding LytR/AlgR family response regulator|nr:LytTR family DNA-binding domain-containing protein [Spirochaetaceae bacterium]